MTRRFELKLDELKLISGGVVVAAHAAATKYPQPPLQIPSLPVIVDKR
jgi:hypothetical protein